MSQKQEFTANARVRVTVEVHKLRRKLGLVTP
jgi:hypothetical protein